VTLLEWLILKYPTAKRQTLRRMFDDRRITVNGRKPASLKVTIGPDDDVLVVDRDSRRNRREPSHRSLPFRIVFEDADILVIDKPSGLLTATVPRERRPTALAAVTEYFARTDPAARLGMIHRLDRDASGLLVFSKNPAAFHSLKRQFFQHTVDRVYHALVEGVPKRAAAKIESRLIELTDGSVRSSKRPGAGQVAVTEYKLLRASPDRSVALLRVTLHTGRKHQIRAQLSELGHPIVNDATYSKQKRTGQLMLTATELAFDHPRSARRMSFTIHVPRQMTAKVT
jgi:RluA family pseudouridine synthase